MSRVGGSGAGLLADRFDWNRITKSDRAIGWLFVLPSVIVLAAIVIYPFIWLVFNSFFEFNQAGRREGFVGFANFITVLSDGRFLGSIWFTVLFVAVVVTVQFLLGLGIALLLDETFDRPELVTVLSIPPMTLSPIVAGLMWRMLFSPDFGLVNYWTGWTMDWIGQAPWTRVTIIIVDIWMWTPLFVLVFTATLKSIPERYYEAARVDGMDAWQRFKWVTLPQLRTAVVIVLLLRVVRAFKVFPKVAVLTRGGPGSYTETIAMTTYKYGFEFFDIGRATAAGLLYWILMFAVAFVIFKAIAEDVIAPEGSR